MQKVQTQLDEIKLVGIQVRTNNLDEADPSKWKITPCVQRYIGEKLMAKISNRKNPGTTLCAYTDYESDHTGMYTFFIGEEVTDFDSIAEGLGTLTIPPQNYAKFTTDPGPMPTVVIEAWHKIWEMSPEDLGGKRTYKTDFELYDDRACDPTQQRIVLDVYVGIEG